MAPMPRDRTMIPLAALIAALALNPPATAQQEGPREKDARAFVVDPTPAPRPALRYRLLPLESDRTPGDAAPVYLRLRHELEDERYRKILENYEAWVQPPKGELPVAEARKFLESWRFKTDQLAFGARRKTCDWAYTLPEQAEHAYMILLPDAQGMRTWCRLLEIKARTEMLEGHHDEAIRTIETGLGFARHVGDGPFLINSLVGNAMATSMIYHAEELVARPGAPNLYWALTALPRPLVGIRDAMETEQRMGEYVAPELADTDRPRTDAEWTSLLIRLVGRLSALQDSLRTTVGGRPTRTLPAGLDVVAFRFRYLAAAKRALAEGPAPAGPMTDDRALVLFVVGRYRDLRDAAFKPLYLPFPETAALDAEAQARTEAERVGPIGSLADLAPQASAAQQAEVRLDRRVAALRVVEALRMHAAAHGGKLPAALDAVTAVPIPLDPVTGKPFEYRLEGDTAVLIGPASRIAPPWIYHRITIRK